MKIKTYMGVDRAKIPWWPAIDEEQCTGCGACAEFCPNDVFELVDSVAKIKEPLSCVPACDKCASECPVSAISFPPKESLMKTLDELRRVSRLPG